MNSRSLSSLVVLPGFEPRQAEPKTAVLPLHHKTILIAQAREEPKASAKLHTFFDSHKFFIKKTTISHSFLLKLWRKVKILAKKSVNSCENKKIDLTLQSQIAKAIWCLSSVGRASD